eukprot:scaffold78145_cov36-Prasinocladus_malaysianus.AAC.4
MTPAAGGPAEVLQDAGRSRAGGAGPAYSVWLCIAHRAPPQAGHQLPDGPVEAKSLREGPADRGAGGRRQGAHADGHKLRQRQPADHPVCPLHRRGGGVCCHLPRSPEAQGLPTASLCLFCPKPCLRLKLIKASLPACPARQSQIEPRL